MAVHPFLVALAFAGPFGQAEPTVEQLTEQLRQAGSRIERAGPVRNGRPERDAARFQLESGTLFQLAPVADRPIALVFIGKGGSPVVRLRIRQEGCPRIF